ncbi:3-oxoacyl-[acyl-carrier-protein] reductase [Halogranum rubrum]|uniref:3-oxoacyl-[acyl-carrier-protein] reductase n=1 Tax=Halogranum rubrum TaxID=553466 RepID=A0A1I4BRU6_9EURY|nr:beta-ketoacyl-ACP reductase [Halogranum rubrum]SFK71542.1 3-oxoacyl-[acyl-carrier-protein] reductase [Halogranum rubrum]
MSTNRTCVVTGASRGIGRGIAEELGGGDTNVVVNYRSSEGEAYEVVDTIEEQGGTAIAVQGDVTNLDEMHAMADRVRDVFGGADVLVNNAGITVDKTFKNMTRDDWDAVMDVNLGGVFNASKAFYDDIKAADDGRLINISSVVGQQGNYGQANYATTKSGLFGFTRTLALELSNSGSTVNCVAPGFTETDMLAEVSPEVQEKIQKRIPLDRFATVEDISGVVEFLASEESSYMTGQILGVNGGMEW